MSRASDFFYKLDKLEEPVVLNAKTRSGFIARMLDRYFDEIELFISNKLQQDPYNPIERDLLNKLSSKSQKLLFLLFILDREKLINHQELDKYYLHYRNLLDNLDHKVKK